MRRALALVAVVVLVALAAWTLTRPASPVASPSPTPSATSTAADSPTPAASPTSTGSPGPTPTGTAIPFGAPVTEGDVTVRAIGRSSGPDFRYIVTGQGSGTNFWIVLLDLGGKTAQTLAQIDVVVPQGSQAVASVEVSSTSSGDRVLVAATEADGSTHLFLIEARQGAVRRLASHSTLSVAVIAADGSRYAHTDTSDDPRRAGLWVTSTNGGQNERVVADDPATSPGRPRPIAFSPDNTQIAAVVDVADQRSGVLIAPSGGGEVNEVGAGGGVLLEPGAEFSWGGAPGDAWAWEGVGDLGGGANAIHSFDTRTGEGTLVYRPAQGSAMHQAGRSPRLDRFFTHEGPGVIGAGPGAIWVRTRDGAATKVRDVGMTGPSRAWWSYDGTKLYAFSGGDDSVGNVVELFSGEGVVHYCLRGPTGDWDCV